MWSRVHESLFLKVLLRNHILEEYHNRQSSCGKSHEKEGMKYGTV